MRSSMDCRKASNADEDRAIVPLEHEWMMCASHGEWAGLHDLLSCEPSLISKKDLITGFTCLHWAAKQGKPELLALIVNFAKQHATPININARSSAGYTPLHLAALHNHADVVKLLVGAYDADVDIRDYNGKRASQYLADSVTVDMRDIIGAHGDSDSENTDLGDGGRWRFSKVFHSTRKSFTAKGSFKSRPKTVDIRDIIGAHGDSDSENTDVGDEGRWRFSKVFHSTRKSFMAKGSFKSRPKKPLAQSL